MHDTNNLTHTVTRYCAGCENPLEVVKGVTDIDTLTDPTLQELQERCIKCRQEALPNDDPCYRVPLEVTVTITLKPVVLEKK